MGVIILDGAEIGARSIIGAKCLVTLGTKIPPGSLVLGSPAKVKRALTLEEQKDIAGWAWSYVEPPKHFREFYSQRIVGVRGGRRPVFLILLIQRNEPG